MKISSISKPDDRFIRVTYTEPIRISIKRLDEHIRTCCETNALDTPDWWPADLDAVTDEIAVEAMQFVTETESVREFLWEYEYIGVGDEWEAEILT